MPTLSPEQKARQEIDKLLGYAGWDVQNRDSMNLFDPNRPGVAVREAHLRTGYADYLLFVQGKALGVIEAKKVGVPLTGVEAQAERYSGGLQRHMQAWIADKPLPFLYQSTGVETFFTNGLDPQPRSRRVFAFHRPETLAAWVQELVTLRQRLRHLPALDESRLWSPQARAVRQLEWSLAQDRPRALIQMATGSGKTFTAVNFVYRLIKHANARRVLFLVDRTNLGTQAYNEFQQFITPDDGRKFSELYNIRHLTTNLIDPAQDVNRVYIATIQRLYSILRGEELEEEREARSLYEQEEAGEVLMTPRTVTANGRLPIEFFDFIVIDECHRSIYTVWKQVLEYFDAYYIGLTATPGKQTIGFFNQNLVMEYTHENAVADGINVQGEVYRILTRISERGSMVEAGFYVDKMDRRTRAERQELLDEELVYEARQLDREVVSESQIRTIIRKFRDVLFTELFPNRPEHIVPKTLIFAKDDNHAENIVRIVREEFGKGNDFCKKITYRAEGRPEDLLQDFRNSYHPRIAVTVDMIATGVDVRAIEILLFMRLVRSRSYYEQMRGRGTRIIKEDELQAVTRDAGHKTHFVLVDAVGLSEAKLVDTTPPLERKRSESLHQLLESAGYGQHDADTVSTLAGRLARLQHKLTDDDRRVIAEVTDGRSLPTLVNGLLDALDADRELEAARTASGQAEPDTAAVEAAGQQLRWAATELFRTNPNLRRVLEEIQERSEIVIDRVSEDKVVRAGYDTAATDRLRQTVESFREFIEQHKDEITALQILYNQPHGRQALTIQQVKELAERLKQPPHLWTEEKLWNAYAQLERDRVRDVGGQRVLTDVISLVRHALYPDEALRPYPELVRQRYEAWLAAQEQAGKRFSDEQRWWLDRIAAFIGLNLAITPQDFEIDGEFVNRGGRWGVVDSFGSDWLQILDNLNNSLLI
jgi:type I restriction enzyme R subunit